MRQGKKGRSAAAGCFARKWSRRSRPQSRMDMAQARVTEDANSGPSEKAQRSKNVLITLVPILLSLLVILADCNVWVAAICVILATFPWLIQLFRSESWAAWKSYFGEIRASF